MKSQIPPFFQFSGRTLSHEKYPFTGDFGNTHAVPPTPEWGGRAPHARIDPSSTIEKLKNRIKDLYDQTPHSEAEEKNRALKGYFRTYLIKGHDYKDPKLYLTDVQLTVTRVIESNLSKGLKVRLSLKCEMMKESPNAEGEYTIATPYFNSNMKVILRKDITISDEYRYMLSEIFEKIANFQREGSGWRFRQVIHVEIHLNKYEPLSGSSYIPLPKTLQSKKAIINVQNKQDNQCFKWAIASAIYPVEINSNRLTKYVDNSKKFNWDGINFPASLRDVDIFEKLNPTFTVNVFGYEKEVYPLRISNKANDNTVNLLLISEGENKHFCWIKKYQQTSDLSNQHACKQTALLSEMFKFISHH